MVDLLNRQPSNNCKHSCGLQEVQCLLGANPIKALPWDAEDVSAFFADTGKGGCRARVPVTERLLSWAARHAPECAKSLVAIQGSALASRLTAILYTPPFDHTLNPHDAAWGNLAAMAAATMFLDTVLDSLNECSGSSVAYSLVLNRGHTGGSSGSSDGGTKSRPDMLLAVNSCTVVLGQFTHHQDMTGAVEELVSKLGALDSHQYRPLPYIFAVTGAGSQLQLHIMSARLGRMQIEAVTGCIDVAHLSGRIRLVLVLAKLHSLLVVMSKSLPQRFGRSCHFTRTITRPGMVLEFLPDAVRKSVRDFTAYTAQNYTSLEAVMDAHRAAREAAKQARSSKTRQVLACAQSDPVLMFDTYTVTTGPIGTLAEPSDQEDLRSLAYTCCKAADILHRAGLVYRDWRLCNLVKLPSSGTWMVIDMELVAHLRHNLVPTSYALAEWAPDTLEHSRQEQLGMARYTEASDMYQIGVLLQKCAEHLGATATHEEKAGYQGALTFIHALLSKRLSAAAALNHEYLQPLAGT